METKDAAEPTAPPPYAPQTVQPQEVEMKLLPQTAPPQATGPPGGQVQMMAPPPAMPGVPPGLEYLTQIDQLLVHQQVELLELMSGYEMCNKYQVKNTIGQQVYFAAEESGMCMRQCCGPLRGFVIHIINNHSQEVMRVVREFKCCGGRCRCCACCECCQSEIYVEAPIGQIIGFVREQCTVCRPKFVVLDGEKTPVFSINGPLCQCQPICCPKDLEFQVASYDGGHVIGKVSKQWTGFVRETMTNADNFGINFPIDLDVKMKALLLGSVFLIHTVNTASNMKLIRGKLVQISAFDVFEDGERIRPNRKSAIRSADPENPTL